MPRLAVVASHPIQYYAPLFRELAGRLDVEVFYGQALSPTQQARAGFDHPFDWDVDLLSGYPSKFLSNVSLRPGPDHFFGCDTPEIGRALQEGRFDAVLVLGWYLKAFVQAVAAAKRCNIPVMVRGDSQLYSPRSRAVRMAKAVVFPSLLRTFDAALHVGQRSRAYLEHYGYPADRQFFSPHCVDNVWFSGKATTAARHQLRARLGIGPDEKAALFAGKLVAFKRPLDLIEACALEPARGTHVIVAGSGAYEGLLRERAAVLGVRLHLLGFQNQTQMPAAYAACDMLVLPSDGQETWGLVANEALASSRPIIVSDAAGCAPDLAADGLAGRSYAMGDVAALARAVADIGRSPPTAEQLAKRADAFSVPAAIHGVELALDRVVPCKQTTPPPSIPERNGRGASSEIRILALFGARVLFGQELANIEALVALQGQGCKVLCVIRPEEWPELLAIRSALEARGLAWVVAPYIDYPVRGWLIHAALHNPIAFVRGNAALRRILRGFAPTHIHAFNPFYVAAFYPTLHSTRIPMVYRAGDKPTRHNFFYRAIWRFIVRRTARFVAISRYIERELVSSGALPSRVSVIYGRPPLRPEGKTPQLPSLPVEESTTLRYCYAGQLAAHKGVDILIDALRLMVPSHPNAHLLIAGRISDWSGDDWARNLRDRALADPLLNGRVHFLGFVEDAPALMRRCQVHVAPSVFEEPLGNVLLEAKSVARPSIIFASGGMTELIEDGVDGFVLSEKTAPALATAMARYADEPSLAERQGKAAKESLSELRLEFFGERWREVYERASSEIRILALFGARVLFGQELANIEALVALQEQGCKVLCVIRPEEWPELLAIRSALEARGLAWVVAPYIDYPVRGWLIHAALHNPIAFVRGNAALRRILRGFAPTHIHAFNPFYVAAFYPTLHSTRIPMVYRAGDKPTRHNFFYRAIWRFIVRRTARFVADSRYIERELVSSGVHPSRASVLYAPPPKRNPVSAGIPAVADGSERFRFVYVGQLVSGKGVDILIDALRLMVPSHPNAHLLIAGRISDWSGDDWARNLRDRALADPLLNGRVHFLGFVENPSDLVRRCHAHVAPSIWDEGYGLVVAEAKSAGRPSIIFASGGMTELIEDGVDGFVLSEKTAPALATAMARYASDPQLVQAHGHAAKVSLTRFEFDAFPARWLATYQRSTVASAS